MKMPLWMLKFSNSVKRVELFFVRYNLGLKLGVPLHRASEEDMDAFNDNFTLGVSRLLDSKFGTYSMFYVSQMLSNNYLLNTHLTDIPEFEECPKVVETNYKLIRRIYEEFKPHTDLDSTKLVKAFAFHTLNYGEIQNQRNHTKYKTELSSILGLKE